MSAGARPWLGAIAGAFKPPDFAQDVAAAQLSIEGLNPYGADFTARHAHLLGTSTADGYPFFPHPPFVIVLSLPFTFQPFPSAALMWFAVSLGLLAGLAFLLAEMLVARSPIAGRGSPGPTAIAATFVMLLLWPPVLYNLEKGQFSILLTFLLALAWRAVTRQQTRYAGVCIGLATAIKLFPGLAVLYLLRREVRAIPAVVMTALVVGGAPFLWIGLHAVPAFLEHSRANLSYWQTWPAVTYSIHGLIARLFVGGTWAEPAYRAPVAAQAAIVVIGIGLVVIALLVTGTRRAVSDDGPVYGVWIALLVLLNPLSMGHNGVLLALPIVFIGRMLYQQWRPLLWIVWSAGVLLVSIPRQTIFEVAPAPIDPAEGMFLVALPMWGTLVLFFICTVLARQSRAATILQPFIISR